MKWWHTRLKRNSAGSLLTLVGESHGEDTGPGQRAWGLDLERGRTGSPCELVSCGSMKCYLVSFSFAVKWG